ncbi:precorrin-3B synthase [Ancylobacter sp. 6x-1]|uniref:Precorrin-3B synthase n=1 Tax=Ancylobacter crimeensis TaxID=2579147 RepID=A0ABT0D9E5_9HYPH|nr:precorrin-3B synthase [Ancylobacter crimeensis]MCK0196573.1 precorrin-3B synthase [Ancylobacter crimeensis]
MSGAPDRRRGACPTLPAPMATGDGLLARIALAAPAMPVALIALGALAKRHGNGLIDVTARGKLQIRGLTPVSAPRLAADVAALTDNGLPIREGLEIQSGALAGRDPAMAFDPRPIVETIAAGAAGGLAGRLAPKVAVVVDGGGALPLAGLSGDIVLMPGGEGRLALFAGGVRLGTVPAERAAAATLALLHRLAQEGPAARMTELVGRHGAESFADRLAGTGFAVQPGDAAPALAVEPIGRFQLADGGLALGFGVAFGQIEADALSGIAEVAQRLGADGVAPVPGRALLLLGVRPEAAEAVRKQAVALGFIAQPDDPRRHIFACPGAPRCASGRLPARALAGLVANRLGEGLGGRDLHISGCAKGCAHPAPADITLVGLDEGAGLVLQGTARGAPGRRFAAADLLDEVARLLETDLG